MLLAAVAEGGGGTEGGHNCSSSEDSNRKDFGVKVLVTRSYCRWQLISYY
jgi:hypothetical protein